MINTLIKSTRAFSTTAARARVPVVGKFLTFPLPYPSNYILPLQHLQYVDVFIFTNQ